ncbi:MAG: hypothetical protein CL927_19270 [Deltaproteobacteria bacterium]|nr:hypothetical protein [Deltaproteobacteria bacterium]HCH65763.1 hypothetical protein [Deltaproteobacteria bacterium]
MSLRDQLLKAGLVNKKKVRQANRQLKKSRRKGQGERKGKRELAQAAQNAEDARKADLRAKAEAARVRRREARLRDERRRAVKAWLRTHRVPMREGNQLFFHGSARGPRIHRCLFPESTVLELRCGRLAIAWDGPSSSDPEYILLPDRTAHRLLELAPERLVFFNHEPPPDDDPAELPYDMGAILDARSRVPDRWSGLR